MTRWQHQTRFGPLDGPVAERGNCLQAALASLLDVPLETMPNAWLDVGDDNNLWKAARVALHERGWDVLNVNAGVLPGYYIACGPNARNGEGHAVVMHDGKLAHDPHPEGGGLAKLDTIALVMPLDPGAWTKRATPALPAFSFSTRLGPAK